MHKKDLFLANESNQSKQAVPNPLKAVFSQNIHISFDKNENSEQKRDGLIPAKITKRNTTEHQGPKGNFCLASMLLPRVPLHSPLLHPTFSLFPHCSQCRIKPLFTPECCSYSEARKTFGGFKSHSFSPVNVPAKSHPPYMLKTG